MPPPYGSHPGDLPPLLLRLWGYEAAQTAEPIPAPNTTVGTGERLCLSPRRTQWEVQQHPSEHNHARSTSLIFLRRSQRTMLPHRKNALQKSWLDYAACSMRLKQIYRLLPWTTLREGPLADLPASPHGSLNLVGPAIQAAAPDQEAAQTENLNVDPIEGPRLSVVSGMSYAPGDDILDTARDDTGLEQSRDDTAWQASQSGQTASSAPSQQPADDCIVTNWQDRSTLRTAPALIDTQKTLDPEWSPPPPSASVSILVIFLLG